MSAAMRARVEAVLNDIFDPCSRAAGVPAGLVDMGLVGTLEVRDRADGTWDVRVSIKVTEPGCLMGAPFVGEARRRLAELPDIAALEVDLDHVIDWTPEHMTPAYRERLESHRALRRSAPGEHVVRVVRTTHQAMP